MIQQGKNKEKIPRKTKVNFINKFVIFSFLSTYFNFCFFFFSLFIYFFIFCQKFYFNFHFFVNFFPIFSFFLSKFFLKFFFLVKICFPMFIFCQIFSLNFNFFRFHFFVRNFCIFQIQFQPSHAAILEVDAESPFGVEDIKYETGSISVLRSFPCNISYDHEMRVKAATLVKIIEWITSHTALPEQRNAFQETAEEYETRKKLRYSFLGPKNGPKK